MIRMDEATKLKLEQVDKKMQIANGFRLLFLFLSLIILLFLFFGRKVWEGVAWFDHITIGLYVILCVFILSMVCANFIKIFFAAKHNKIIKSL